jgi:hypothetical protein
LTRLTQGADVLLLSPLSPGLIGLSASIPQANIGQKEDFEEARKKALKLGAKKV